MPDEKDIKELTHQQKVFCEEYVFDWNGTRSYKVAYIDCKSDETAAASASRLLRIDKVSDYITEIQKDLAKIAGISRLMVIREHQKIAFSNIAHLHNTWIERKNFEHLTDIEKACIESIDTKVIKSSEKGNKIEHVKIKLYDKQKSLDAISKMLGYNEPEKHNLKFDLSQITGMEVK